MGGGLPLTIAAGGDWPGWILDMEMDRELDTCSSVQDELMMSRYDMSFFLPKHLDHPAHCDFMPCVEKCQVEAILFDMDDTLYLERDFVFSGYRAVAEKVWQDHRVDILEDLQYRFSIGQRGDLFTPALAAGGICAGEPYVKKLVEVYRQHQPDIRPCLDTAVLKELKAKGFKLGLISDGIGSVQRNKLSALGLEPLFDQVVFSDELGGREAWKPSTRPYLTCLNHLDVPASLACYVADNPGKDFMAPRQLGMLGIQIIRPGALYAQQPSAHRLAAPDMQIQSLIQLEHYLQLSTELKARRAEESIESAQHERFQS